MKPSRWKAGGIVIGVIVTLAAYALHLRARPRLVRAIPVVMVGDHLSLPGVRWSDPSERTIVMVTSGGCGSCIANKPFNEVLASRAHALHLPVVYVLSVDPGEDTEASRIRKSGEMVSRGILGALGVAFTPTTLAVDSHGEVIASWVGSVPRVRTDSLVAELTSGRGSLPYTAIETSAVERIVKENPDYQVLGFMGSQADSPFGSHYKVIPANELAIRARYELRPGAATLVDCDAAKSVIECQSALMTLSQIYQFKRLFALGLRPGLSEVTGKN